MAWVSPRDPCPKTSGARDDRLSGILQATRRIARLVGATGGKQRPHARPAALLIPDVTGTTATWARGWAKNFRAHVLRVRNFVFDVESAGD